MVLPSLTQEQDSEMRIGRSELRWRIIPSFFPLLIQFSSSDANLRDIETLLREGPGDYTNKDCRCGFLDSNMNSNMRGVYAPRNGLHSMKP